MNIDKISLTNFRNYAEVNAKFSPKVNCLVGPNGSGKTNLLEAIYYLSFCKGYIHPIDAQNVKEETDFMRLSGFYKIEDEQYNVVVKLADHRKKEILCNEVKYKKFSEHIGLIPLIIVTPDDIDIVKGGSENRRKLLDNLLMQIDKQYLRHLIDYNKALQQRNALLKKLKGSNNINPVLFEIYDQTLLQCGNFIYGRRKELLEKLKPAFIDMYAKIAGKQEEVEFVYESLLNNESFENLLKQSFEKDCILQRTSVGIHKDDVIFTLKGNSIKKYGSQGQQKSFLLGLKLAEANYLGEAKGHQPILLLDDVFDKLDPKRVKSLITLVCGENKGQVFFSDTNVERIPNLLKETGVEHQSFYVENGKIELLEKEK